MNSSKVNLCNVSVHRSASQDIPVPVNPAQFYKLIDFENAFRDVPEPSVCQSVSRSIRTYFRSCDVKQTLLRLFPVTTTFRLYRSKWREYLPNDMISGFTSGVKMIPQGLAFAKLATLPPIVGLYMAFFASVTYFVLGTGRQLSWSNVAVLSLMVATVLDTYQDDKSNMAASNSLPCLMDRSLPSDALTHTTQSTPAQSVHDLIITPIDSSGRNATTIRNAQKIEIASGIAVVSGLVLIAASQFGLSKIFSLMSTSLITGFIVGVSFQIATSQIKGLLGLSFPRLAGTGSMILTWVEIFKHLPETNVATLMTSVICLSAIYLVKRCINERYKDKLIVPFPIELVVIIVVTLVSIYGKLNTKFKVDIVKHVPIGVPAPNIPDLSLMTDYIGPSLAIIVVSYAQSLSVAKIQGQKNNYEIDAKQEMLACGMCSLVCGLFSGYIPAASVNRSFVQEGTGGKTQMASLFAAAIVLLSILFMGPYFYYLPFCVLSSIILVNLRGVFLMLLEVPSVWRKSPYDCAVWVFTCVVTIVFDVDKGLLLGVLFSIFLVLLRSMMSPVTDLGQISNGDSGVQLRSIRHYTSATRCQSVKIIKINTSLYFINADVVTTQVLQRANLKDSPMSEKQDSSTLLNESNELKSYSSITEPGAVAARDSSVVILDVSSVTFIDLMGVQALTLLMSEFERVDRQLVLTGVPETILPMLKSTDFLAKHGDKIFLNLEAVFTQVVNTTHDYLSE